MSAQNTVVETIRDAEGSSIVVQTASGDEFETYADTVHHVAPEQTVYGVVEGELSVACGPGDASTQYDVQIHTKTNEGEWQPLRISWYDISDVDEVPDGKWVSDVAPRVEYDVTSVEVIEE